MAFTNMSGLVKSLNIRLLAVAVGFLFTVVNSLFAEPVIEVYLKHEGLHESNIIKPRIYLHNSGAEAITGFYFFYYFTVDEGKNPVPEAWYAPNTIVTLENRENGLYRARFDCSSVQIPAGGIFPDLGGISVGLHYSDFSEWNKQDDYSLPQTKLFLYR